MLAIARMGGTIAKVYSLTRSRDMARSKKSTPALHESDDDFNQEAPDEEPARVIDEEDQDDAPEANGKISKAQAVRNAQAEGLDKPGDIADFARTRYGLEITNQQASAYKAQAKARGKKDDAEERTVSHDEADQAGASKTDLIREAVQAGYEKPAHGVAYIREKHGVEIDAKYYSIVKGKLGKAGEQPASAPAAPAPQKAAAAAPRADQSKATGSVPASLFDDLKQLRQMKDRYGEDFDKMVEAIG